MYVYIIYIYIYPIISDSIANISQNHQHLWSFFGGLPSRHNDMPQQWHARDTVGSHTMNWEPALRCVLELLSIEVVFPLQWMKPMDHGLVKLGGSGGETNTTVTKVTEVHRKLQGSSEIWGWNIWNGLILAGSESDLHWGLWVGHKPSTSICFLGPWVPILSQAKSDLDNSWSPASGSTWYPDPVPFLSQLPLSSAHPVPWLQGVPIKDHPLACQQCSNHQVKLRDQALDLEKWKTTRPQGLNSFQLRYPFF